METDLTFWFYNKLADDKLCLLYNGSFSDNLTSRFIELSEYNLNSSTDLSKMRNKVSFLMAECFQNIVRHGEISSKDEEESELPGFFSTKNLNNTYFITSGNLIRKDNISKLESQLQQVNQLSSEELKELYREVMDKQGFSEKGGAGLGLIEMARKSGHRIEYAFEKYNEFFSFFYSQIRLERNVEDVHFTLVNSVGFHQLMNENGILLIQKGDFSQETILPVLKIIEQNFSKARRTRKNRAVYHVLVELLQNVSKYSMEINNRHDGIFMILQNGDLYKVASGNFVSADKVSDFERRLKVISQSSDEKLEELYKKEMIEEPDPDFLNIGMGLIDIARKGSQPLQYWFHKTDEDKVFFSMMVTI
jgi:hypothetical protein